MVFLVIIGIMMLILSGFYLANSWQRYGTWIWPTFLVIFSIAITAYGVVKLPYWSGDTAAQRNARLEKAASDSSGTSSSSPQFSSINNTGLTGMTGSQTDAAMQQNVLTQLQKSYQSIGSVAYDDSSKTFNITPTSDKVVEGLNYIIKDKTTASDVGWSNLTKNFVKTSKSIKEAMGSGYSVTLLEPDGSQAMFTAKDGKTTYDIAQ